MNTQVRVRNYKQTPEESSLFMLSYPVESLSQLEKEFRQHTYTDEEGNTYHSVKGAYNTTKNHKLYYEFVLSP